MTDARIAVFAGLLDSLVQTHGLDIEFFPFQPEQDGGDAKIARRVQNLMREQAHSRILDWTIDVAEIATRFARSKLVFAMRLHAAVLAATYRAPCILMPYDQKVVEFGLQAQIHHTLTPEDLDQPELAHQTIEDMMANPVPPAALPPSADWLTLTLSEFRH
jgi:polysaccharide pyruvyl transferase WcaK-like protein